jgi:hypothetical protein
VDCRAGVAAAVHHGGMNLGVGAWIGIVLGLIALFWLGVALSRAFASPERKAEIDAGRRRRNIGVIAGDPGASGWVTHPGQQVPEEPVTRPE